MSEPPLSQRDGKEILRNQELIIKLLTPVFTVSVVARLADRSPQAVREWITNNAEPEVDYYLKGGKIILSEKIALEYINARR